MRDLIDDVVVDRPKLRNAPLKAVICQVRFPRQLDLAASELRPIQLGLADRYPVLVEEVAAELTIETSPSPQAYFAPSRQQTIYRFRDTAEAWTATVGPEAISLETTSYVGMRDLLERWAEFISLAQDALALRAQSRLGLRYVNELPCPGRSRERLEGWVREELIALIGAHPTRTSDLVRLVSQAQFRQPGGAMCNFRHGVALDPTDAERSLFLLDLDYFRDELGDFDLERQIRMLASFNQGARELFEWTFPDGTRVDFGPEEPTGPSAKKGER
ncbi:MAG TPA: TIGR04255 family protein [Solirubrobacterales bacterium]|nr:TIGR04255 family protein [Solirubrobacterales bacterium]